MTKNDSNMIVGDAVNHKFTFPEIKKHNFSLNNGDAS